MKVLVVEDDSVAELLVEAALKSLGHEVVLTADGEEAWEALSRDPSLRIVVSDWQLPRLDGLGLCRRIREKRADYVCVLLVTRHGATGDNLDAAFAAGVDEFLTKPLNVHDLRLRLHVAERILGFTTELHRLESFMPICGYCKKVRDDKKYWQDIETYIAKRAGTRFSHGVCPECWKRVVVPQLEELGIPDPKASGAEPEDLSGGGAAAQGRV